MGRLKPRVAAAAVDLERRSHNSRARWVPSDPAVPTHRLKRRNFLQLSAGAAAILWHPALAATGPRIGFIAAGSRAADHGPLVALHDGLHALGWTDGEDCTILDRWAEAHAERLPDIARALAGAPVDILVAAGTQATLAATSATQTIPIVMVGVGDPVAIGLVESLAQPGGNITGISLSSPELIDMRLKLLAELVPHLHRIAII